MKKLILTLLALTALVLVLSAQPMDKPPMDGKCPMCMEKGNMMPPPEMGEGMPPMGMMEALKLTDQQKKQMKDLMADHMKLVNTKEAELKNLQIDKMKAMQSQDFTAAKKANADITAAQLVLMNAKVDLHANMLNILTADQKDAMQKMMAERKPMMKEQMRDKDRKGGFWGKHKHKGDKMQCKGDMKDCKGDMKNCQECEGK